MHSLESFQRLQARLEIGQVPNRDGVIFGRGDEPASVAGETQAADRVGVATELADLLPCRAVIQLQAWGPEAIEHGHREHRQSADRTRPRGRECEVRQLVLRLELNLAYQVSFPPERNRAMIVAGLPLMTCRVWRNCPPTGLRRDHSGLEVDDEIAGRRRAGRIAQASLRLSAQE